MVYSLSIIDGPGVKIPHQISRSSGSGSGSEKKSPSAPVYPDLPAATACDEKTAVSTEAHPSTGNVMTSTFGETNQMPFRGRHPIGTLSDASMFTGIIQCLATIFRLLAPSYAPRQDPITPLAEGSKKGKRSRQIGDKQGTDVPTDSATLACILYAVVTLILPSVTMFGKPNQIPYSQKPSNGGKPKPQRSLHAIPRRWSCHVIRWRYDQNEAIVLLSRSVVRLSHGTICLS